MLWGEHLDVERLTLLNEEAREAIAQNDDDLVSAINQAFHHVVLSAMGSKTLGDTMDQLDAFLRLATLPIVQQQPTFHRQFIDVNEHLVELLLEERRQEASDYLQESLEEQGRMVNELIAKINNGEPI